MIPVDSENVAPVTGDAHAQLSPYLTHCMGMLSCAYDEAVLEKLIDAGSIRFVPLGLLRGATFLHEYVVADEMQNASVAQFRMLLTRMGEGSRLIITGDIAQHDQHGQVSGLADFVARLSKVGEVQSIRHVELTASDVVRDDVVREVLRIYDTS
jgi:phosphate starvation-inducible PhoH-like protein